MNDQDPKPESLPTREPPPAALKAELAKLRKDLKKAQDLLEAAKNREVLLRGELQHRLRNVLAIMRSIFSRTVANGGSIEDIADHFRGRLDTIARYQSLSSIAPGGTIDFEQLVRDELHSFQFGDDPAIDIEGEEVRISLDVAQLAALAVHELVTNSIKFGTLSGSNEHSRLRIEWTVTGAELRFQWRESGVSVIGSAPLRRGFGREFIEQALPYQIGASSSFDLHPGRLTCIITMPLDAVAVPMI